MESSPRAGGVQACFQIGRCFHCSGPRGNAREEGKQDVGPGRGDGEGQPRNVDLYGVWRMTGDEGLVSMHMRLN